MFASSARARSASAGSRRHSPLVRQRPRQRHEVRRQPRLILLPERLPRRVLPHRRQHPDPPRRRPRQPRPEQPRGRIVPLARQQPPRVLQRQPVRQPPQHRVEPPPGVRHPRRVQRQPDRRLQARQPVVLARRPTAPQHAGPLPLPPGPQRPQARRPPPPRPRTARSRAAPHPAPPAPAAAAGPSASSSPAMSSSSSRSYGSTSRSSSNRTPQRGRAGGAPLRIDASSRTPGMPASRASRSSVPRSSACQGVSRLSSTTSAGPARSAPRSPPRARRPAAARARRAARPRARPRPAALSSGTTQRRSPNRPTTSGWQAASSVTVVLPIPGPP